MRADEPGSRVMAVFGEWPKAIQMSPVVSALRAPSSNFEVIVLVIAQRRHVLDHVLQLKRFTFPLQPHPWRGHARLDTTVAYSADPLG